MAFSILDRFKGAFQRANNNVLDTVVTDERGMPRVVYHGTRTRFKQFGNPNPRSLYGPGFYFTESREEAEMYSQVAVRMGGERVAGRTPRVLSRRLAIRRPFDIGAVPNPEDTAAALATASSRGVPLQPWRVESGVTAGHKFYDLLTAIHGDDRAAVNQWLQSRGYDAIRYQMGYRGQTQTHWVAFSPHQIKPATAWEASIPARLRSGLQQIHQNLESKAGQFFKWLWRLPFKRRSRVDPLAAAAWGAGRHLKRRLAIGLLTASVGAMALGTPIAREWRHTPPEVIPATNIDPLWSSVEGVKVLRGFDHNQTFAEVKPSRLTQAEVWTHGFDAPWTATGPEERPLWMKSVLSSFQRKTDVKSLLILSCNPENVFLPSPPGKEVIYGLGSGYPVRGAPRLPSWETGVVIARGARQRLYPTEALLQLKLRAEGSGEEVSKSLLSSYETGIFRGRGGQPKIALIEDEVAGVGLPAEKVPFIEATVQPSGKRIFRAGGIGTGTEDVDEALQSLLGMVRKVDPSHARGLWGLGQKYSELPVPKAISGVEASVPSRLRAGIQQHHVNLESRVGQFFKRLWRLPFKRRSATDPLAAAVQAMRTFQQSPGEFLRARSHFSDIETEALTRYKGFGFASINQTLRASPAALHAEGAAVVNTLDELTHAATVEKAFSVYRGFSSIPGLEGANLVGKEFTDPGFASASLNPYVAEQFAQKKESFVAEIRMRRGNKGFLLSSHETWAKGDKEAEFLLPRGTQFRVLEQHAPETSYGPRRLVLEAITPEHRPTPLQQGLKAMQRVKPTARQAAATAESIAAKQTLNELHQNLESKAGQFFKKVMRLPFQKRSRWARWLTAAFASTMLAASVAPLHAQGVDPPVNIARGNPSIQSIALTFDDGPYPRSTRRILRILKEEGVTATFFVKGENVLAHPEIARQMQQEGHLLAHHTMRHERLLGLSQTELELELAEGEVAIRRVTGRSPRFFRAPGGRAGAREYEAMRRHHLAHVLWTDNPGDFRAAARTEAEVNEAARRLSKYLVEHAHPGAIVLLHDEAVGTVPALRRTIRMLRAQGYSFETVAQMARSQPMLAMETDTYGKVLRARKAHYGEAMGWSRRVARRVAPTAGRAASIMGDTSRALGQAVRNLLGQEPWIPGAAGLGLLGLFPFLRRRRQLAQAARRHLGGLRRGMGEFFARFRKPATLPMHGILRRLVSPGGTVPHAAHEWLMGETGWRGVLGAAPVTAAGVASTAQMALDEATPAAQAVVEQAVSRRAMTTGLPLPVTVPSARGAFQMGEPDRIFPRQRSLDPLRRAADRAARFQHRVKWHPRPVAPISQSAALEEQIIQNLKGGLAGLEETGRGLAEARSAVQRQRVISAAPPQARPTVEAVAVAETKPVAISQPSRRVAASASAETQQVVKQIEQKAASSTVATVAQEESKNVSTLLARKSGVGLGVFVAAGVVAAGGVFFLTGAAHQKAKQHLSAPPDTMSPLHGSPEERKQGVSLQKIPATPVGGRTTVQVTDAPWDMGMLDRGFTNEMEWGLPWT